MKTKDAVLYIWLRVSGKLSLETCVCIWELQAQIIEMDSGAQQAWLRPRYLLQTSLVSEWVSDGPSSHLNLSEAWPSFLGSWISTGHLIWFILHRSAYVIESLWKPVNMANESNRLMLVRRIREFTDHTLFHDFCNLEAFWTSLKPSAPSNKLYR